MTRPLSRQVRRAAARRAGGRDRRAVQRGRAGSAPPFVPSSLSNLALQLEFGQPSTLRQEPAGTTAVALDGDPIGRAADQGPSTRVYTASGSARPLYRASAMSGGRSCAQFDGIDDGLTATAAWTTFSAQTWALDFELTALPGTGASMCLLSLADGTYSNALYAINHASYASFSWEFCYQFGGSHVGFGALSGGSLDLGRHRLVITYNFGTQTSPASYRVWLDGVEQTVVTSGGSAVLASGCGVGARADGVSFLQGRMRHAWVWAADHSASVASINAGLQL